MPLCSYTAALRRPRDEAAVPMKPWGPHALQLRLILRGMPSL